MIGSELIRQGWDDYIRRKVGDKPAPECDPVRAFEAEPPHSLGLSVPAKRAEEDRD
jgi:hypothetical protein